MIDFVVSVPNDSPCHVFLGYHKGTFRSDNGQLISFVSGYFGRPASAPSNDSTAVVSGLRTEKYSVVSLDCFSGLALGDLCILYFDQYKRVLKIEKVDG